MKNLFLTSLLSILSPLLMAQLFHQPQHFPDQHPDSVMRQNPRIAKMLFEPGEILVRFADELNVNIFKSNGMAQIGIAAIDALFIEFEVLEANQLISGSQPLKQKQILRTFTGKEFEQPSLHNIYKLKFATEGHRMFELIEALKEDKNILYAEPNYIYNLLGHEAISPVLTSEELAYLHPSQQKTGKGHHSNQDTIVPNDPYYDQQWWIGAINADMTWEISTGDTNQVIAILDTGVDWLHPDLENKIWINPNESLNGQDSDGNGFVDDIRGWDFINNDNNPMDDNSHGTHVAGIAAAEADNGVGIAGVSWGARIMPVKVLQSSGFGNSATIAQGINYAVNNGATVINMSFGSYERSLTMEDALANAYATSMLVAAAGNDRYCIGPGGPCIGPMGPMFPAALSFVLGVEVPEADWSNYDQDGPTFSNYTELWNYELKAPGTNMLSTIPGGNYRVYQGTSMAAPVVAGAMTVFRPMFSELTQEFLWPKLIQAINFHLDLYAAIALEPLPEVRITEQHLIDTLAGGDSDGRADAGEAIELWYKFRNTGGQADSVYFGIQFAEFEDTTTANIVVSQSYIGSISPYATRTNQTNPVVVEIAPGVAHDRHIVFDAWTTYFPFQDSTWQSIILSVENGTELSGVMDTILTLYPNRLYLVNNSFRVGTNGILNILPGTNLKIYNNIKLENKGLINAIGSADSTINIFGEGTISGMGSANFSYVKFSDLQEMIGSSTPNPWIYDFCQFNNLIVSFPVSFFGSKYLILTNSIIQNSYYHNIMNNNDVNINSNIFNNLIENNYIYNNYMDQTIPIKFCNNIINKIYGNSCWHGGWCNIFSHNQDDFSDINGNSFIGIKDGLYLIRFTTNNDFAYIPSNYYGTTNQDKISPLFYDFWFDASLPQAVFNPILTQPNDTMRGHVWKVLVNGADAQDEYVEPVGVGPQQFDVYFNRSMDVNYTPNLSFGVRFPYNQHNVSDSAYWSEDSTIYTAWKTMYIYTGDGINRIRVSGAKDPDGFEIPVEDTRFEFLIDAAGSASINFMATPGMGKIELEWHEPDDLPTLLGYNMYRFQHITDTTFTDPILINPILVLDTLYTDFDVLPGSKYYYYYKILRTDLMETDSSRVVNGIPLTAAPGDANGDFNVNILDITSIVSYILNGNPQPFIFNAADVNADDQINLLDVIGVVNIIMNGSKSGLISQPGHIYLKPDEIELSSDGTLAGIQFKLVGKNIAALELKSQLKGFEFVRYISGDTLTGMLFNMHNNSIPQGRIKLFDIKQHPGTLGWGDVFGGNTSGRYVAIFKDEDLLPVDHRYGFSVHPNPAKDLMFTDIQLPSTGEVSLHLLDMYGRSIILKDKAILEGGRHHFRFDKQQLSLVKGLYILQLHVRPIDKSELPFRKELKLVVM